MLREEFHFAILRCFNKSNQTIIKKINSSDLCVGQPKILEYLLEHGEARVVEIAEGCVLDKSTVTGIVQRMEKRNLIKKTENKEDARSKNISLTEFGKERAFEIKKIVNEVDDMALKGFSDNEKAKFLEMLNRVIDNLEE